MKEEGNVKKKNQANLKSREEGVTEKDVRESKKMNFGEDLPEC